MKQKNLQDLSESELAELVANAQQELKDRQQGKRKQVIAEIKELAASIGITVELTVPAAGTGRSRRGSKVAIKYRNPEDPSETWTGRGVKPKWLKALVEQGRNLEEFLI